MKLIKWLKDNDLFGWAIMSTALVTLLITGICMALGIISLPNIFDNISGTAEIQMPRSQIITIGITFTVIVTIVSIILAYIAYAISRKKNGYSKDKGDKKEKKVSKNRRSIKWGSVFKWITVLAIFCTLTFLGWRHREDITALMPAESILPIAVILISLVAAVFFSFKGERVRKRAMPVLASVMIVTVVVFMTYMFYPDVATAMLKSKLFWNSACGIVIIVAIASINNGLALLAGIGLAVMVLPQVGFELPNSSATIPTRKPSPEYSKWVRSIADQTINLELSSDEYLGPVDVSNCTFDIAIYGNINVVVNSDFDNPVKLYKEQNNYHDFSSAITLHLQSAEEKAVEVEIHIENH